MPKSTLLLSIPQRMEYKKIGQAGFEPATPSPPDLYANQLRYCPYDY